MPNLKEDINIFQSEIIADLIDNGVTYHIYHNRIYHVVIPSYNNVDMELINKGYAFLNENGGGKFYNIFQFDSFSDIQPEIRDWAADSDGNDYTHTDAIVITSLPQKILADFYLKINRPIKPTKIFYSLDKAIEWTIVQIELNE